MNRLKENANLDQAMQNLNNLAKSGGVSKLKDSLKSNQSKLQTIQQGRQKTKLPSLRSNKPNPSKVD